MQSETNQTRSPSWLRTILIGRQPRFTLLRVVVLIVVTFITFNYLLLPIQVDGPSMLPSYHKDNVKFVNRLAYLWDQPKRGDVVAIQVGGKSPSLFGKSVMYMKRVVALPGEKIEFAHGRLLINGREVDEPYVKYECRWTFTPHDEPLGPDEFYVVGDNRSMQHTDHTQGVAERYRIVGKVVL